MSKAPWRSGEPSYDDRNQQPRSSLKSLLTAAAQHYQQRGGSSGGGGHFPPAKPGPTGPPYMKSQGKSVPMAPPAKYPQYYSSPPGKAPHQSDGSWGWSSGAQEQHRSGSPRKAYPSKFSSYEASGSSPVRSSVARPFHLGPEKTSMNSFHSPHSYGQVSNQWQTFEPGSKYARQNDPPAPKHQISPHAGHPRGQDAAKETYSSSLEYVQRQSPPFSAPSNRPLSHSAEQETSSGPPQTSPDHAGPGSERAMRQLLKLLVQEQAKGTQPPDRLDARKPETESTLPSSMAEPKRFEPSYKSRSLSPQSMPASHGRTPGQQQPNPKYNHREASFSSFSSSDHSNLPPNAPSKVYFNSGANAQGQPIHPQSFSDPARQRSVFSKPTNLHPNDREDKYSGSDSRDHPHQSTLLSPGNASFSKPDACPVGDSNDAYYGTLRETSSLGPKANLNRPPARQTREYLYGSEDRADHRVDPSIGSGIANAILEQQHANAYGAMRKREGVHTDGSTASHFDKQQLDLQIRSLLSKLTRTLAGPTEAFACEGQQNVRDGGQYQAARTANEVYGQFQDRQHVPCEAPHPRRQEQNWEREDSRPRGPHQPNVDFKADDFRDRRRPMMGGHGNHEHQDVEKMVPYPGQFVRPSPTKNYHVAPASDYAPPGQPFSQTAPQQSTIQNFGALSGRHYSADPRGPSKDHQTGEETTHSQQYDPSTRGPDFQSSRYRERDYPAEPSYHPNYGQDLRFQSSEVPPAQYPRNEAFSDYSGSQSERKRGTTFSSGTRFRPDDHPSSRQVYNHEREPTSQGLSDGLGPSYAYQDRGFETSVNPNDRVSSLPMRERCQDQSYRGPPSSSRATHFESKAEERLSPSFAPPTSQSRFSPSVPQPILNSSATMNAHATMWTDTEKRQGPTDHYRMTGDAERKGGGTTTYTTSQMVPPPPPAFSSFSHRPMSANGNTQESVARPSLMQGRTRYEERSNFSGPPFGESKQNVEDASTSGFAPLQPREGYPGHVGSAKSQFVSSSRIPREKFVPKDFNHATQGGFKVLPSGFHPSPVPSHPKNPGQMAHGGHFSDRESGRSPNDDNFSSRKRFFSAEKGARSSDREGGGGLAQADFANRSRKILGASTAKRRSGSRSLPRRRDRSPTSSSSSQRRVSARSGSQSFLHHRPSSKAGAFSEYPTTTRRGSGFDDHVSGSIQMKSRADFAVEEPRRGGGGGGSGNERPFDSHMRERGHFVPSIQRDRSIKRHRRGLSSTSPSRLSSDEASSAPAQAVHYLNTSSASFSGLPSKPAYHGGGNAGPQGPPAKYQPDRFTKELQKYLKIKQQLAVKTLKQLVADNAVFAPKYITDIAKDFPERVEALLPPVWVHSAFETFEIMRETVGSFLRLTQSARFVERCIPCFMISGLPNVFPSTLHKALIHHFKSHKVSLNRVYIPAYPSTGLAMSWGVLEPSHSNEALRLLMAPQFQWRGMCTRVFPLTSPQLFQLNAGLALNSIQRGRGITPYIDISHWSLEEFGVFFRAVMIQSYAQVKEIAEHPASMHSTPLECPTPFVAMTSNRKLKLCIPTPNPSLKERLPSMISQFQALQKQCASFNSGFHGYAAPFATLVPPPAVGGITPNSLPPAAKDLATGKQAPNIPVDRTPDPSSLDSSRFLSLFSQLLSSAPLNPATAAVASSMFIPSANFVDPSQISAILQPAMATMYFQPNSAGSQQTTGLVVPSAEKSTFTPDTHDIKEMAIADSAVTSEPLVTSADSTEAPKPQILENEDSPDTALISAFATTATVANDGLLSSALSNEVQDDTSNKDTEANPSDALPSEESTSNPDHLCETAANNSEKIVALESSQTEYPPNEVEAFEFEISPSTEILESEAPAEHDECLQNDQMTDIQHEFDQATTASPPDFDVDLTASISEPSFKDIDHLPGQQHSPSSQVASSNVPMEDTDFNVDIIGDGETEAQVSATDISALPEGPRTSLPPEASMSSTAPMKSSPKMDPNHTVPASLDFQDQSGSQGLDPVSAPFEPLPHQTQGLSSSSPSNPAVSPHHPPQSVTSAERHFPIRPSNVAAEKGSSPLAPSKDDIEVSMDGDMDISPENSEQASLRSNGLVYAGTTQAPPNFSSASSPAGPPQTAEFTIPASDAHAFTSAEALVTPVTYPSYPPFRIDNDEIVVRHLNKEDELGFCSLFLFGNHGILGLNLTLTFLAQHRIQYVGETAALAGVYPWTAEFDLNGIPTSVMHETGYTLLKEYQDNGMSDLGIFFSDPDYLLEYEVVPHVIVVQQLPNAKATDAFKKTLANSIMAKCVKAPPVDMIGSTCLAPQAYGIDMFQFAETDRLRGDAVMLLPSTVSVRDVIPDGKRHIFMSLSELETPIELQRVIKDTKKVNDQLGVICSIVSDICEYVLQYIKHHKISMLARDVFEKWEPLSPELQAAGNQIYYDIYLILDEMGPIPVLSDAHIIEKLDIVAEQTPTDALPLMMIDPRHAVCTPQMFLETFFYSTDHFFNQIVLPLWNMHAIKLDFARMAANAASASPQLGMVPQQTFQITASLQAKFDRITNHRVPKLTVFSDTTLLPFNRALLVYRLAAELLSPDAQALVLDKTKSPVEGPLSLEDVSSTATQKILEYLIKYIELHYADVATDEAPAAVSKASQPNQPGGQQNPTKTKSASVIQWLLFENDDDWQATMRIPCIPTHPSRAAIVDPHKLAPIPFELTGDICSTTNNAKTSCALNCLRYMYTLEKQLLSTIDMTYDQAQTVCFEAKTCPSGPAHQSDRSDGDDTALRPDPLQDSGANKTGKDPSNDTDDEDTLLPFEPIPECLPVQWSFSHPPVAKQGSQGDEAARNQLLLAYSPPGENSDSLDGLSVTPWTVDQLRQLQETRQFRYVPLESLVNTPTHQYEFSRLIQTRVCSDPKRFKWTMNNFLFYPKTEDVVSAAVREAKMKGH